GGQNIQARQLFEESAYASRQVTYQIVDPIKNPGLAERYKVTTNSTVHLQYGGEKGEGTNVTELNEEAITNAIIRVTKAGKKVVYFLDGHGESDIDDTNDANGLNQFKTALEGEGFEAKKLLLATQASVPGDCTGVVIAGPQKPLDTHEIDAIGAYLKKGGKALVTLRVPRPDSGVDETALVKLLGDWGVKAGNDIVVDQVVRLFAGPALGISPLVNNYGAHPITRDFKQRTVFPFTRSLSAADSKPGVTVTPIAKTSDSSWAETDLDGLFKRQEAKLDSNDTRGPVDIGEAVEVDLGKAGRGSGQARLVVFGSTDFADNQNIQQFFNRDF